MWESFPHLYPGAHLLTQPVPLAIGNDTSSLIGLYLPLPPPSLFELYSQPRFQKEMSTLVVAMSSCPLSSQPSSTLHGGSHQGQW